MPIMPEPNMSEPLASPPSLEGAPMTEEEMRYNLDNKFNQVDDKIRMLKTNRAMGDIKTDKMKANVVRMLFELMIKAGVNPGDPNSVKQFFESLQQQDPDLYMLFVLGFNQIVGESGQPAQSTGPEQPAPAEEGNAGLMGKYNNLAGETFMGGQSEMPNEGIQENI